MVGPERGLPNYIYVLQKDKNMITKKAEETLQDLGVVDSTRVTNRAMRRKDSGFGKYIADDELVGKRYTKGLVEAIKGGLLGAGGGALLGVASRKRGMPGLGALAGGALGATIGDAKGTYDADKEFLEQRGIRTRRFPHMLLGKVSVTPEAKTRFLPEYR
jgi:hypothetical protein